jgi:hypothetical protein
VRSVLTVPAVSQLAGDELVFRYHASPGDAFLADAAASASGCNAGAGGAD